MGILESIPIISIFTRFDIYFRKIWFNLAISVYNKGVEIRKRGALMKKVFKFFLLLLVLVLVLALGFVFTLHVFEYKPADLIDLSIEDNLANESDTLPNLGDTIRLLTFNIGYASLSETEDFAMDGGTKGRMDSLAEVESNIQGISDIISLAEADIYLLQEVDEDSDRSYGTLQYTHFQNLIGMPSTLGYNYRCIFVPFPFQFSQMMGSVNSGIASFINYHVETSTRHQLPGSFSWPLRLANLKRCMVVSRIPIANSTQYLVVVNVHLSAYDDGSMRLEETNALKQLILDEYDDGNYVIVGGDFNQSFPETVTITENQDGTENYEYLYPLKNPDYWQAFPLEGEWFDDNGFQFAFDSSNPTCRLLHQAYDTVNPDNNQYYVIDGFIVSENVEILHVETLDEDFQFSDHNPVKLEVRLLNP